MPSFFEKLKKGMGIEESVEKGAIEKPKKQRVKKELEVEESEKKEVKIETKKQKEIPKPSFAKTTEGKEKWFEPEGQLAIDVYQTEAELVIQSAIAGVKPESLDISIEGDMVLIKGTREKPVEEEERNYSYQECFWGPFSRQIILSVEVDPSRTEATLKEGILTVRIPKIDREKKRKIMVRG